jgi:hypothetical protein
MFVEKALDTESAIAVADAGAKFKARTQAQKPNPHKPGVHRKEGRPAKMQHEGKIPGGGHISETRQLAQSMGANALGLEGLSEQ